METLPISRLTVTAAKPVTGSTDNVSNDSGAFDQTLQQQMQPQAPKPVENKSQTAKNEAKVTQKTEGSDTDNTEISEDSMADAVTNLIAASTDTQSDTVLVTGEDMLLEQNEADLTADDMDVAAVLSDQILPQGGNTLPQIEMAVAVSAPVMTQSAAIASIAIETENAPVLMDGQNTADDSLLMSINKQETSANMINVQNVEEVMPDAELELTQKAQNAKSEDQFNAVLNNFGRSQAPATQQVNAATQVTGMNFNLHAMPSSSVNVLQTNNPVLNGNIPANVAHPNWGQGVGEHLTMMVQGGLQTAEIKLNPAHLGPMEIHLSLKNDHASVTFVSAHAAVREAIDAAVPKLRDMMEQQGINLTNVDVSAHSGGRQHAEQGQGSSHQANSGSGFEQGKEAQVTSIKTTVQINSGLSLYV